MSTDQNLKKIYLIVGLIVSFIAIYFRLLDVSNISLWRDELVIYFHTSESTYIAWGYSRHHAFHPGVFYLFLKLVYSFTGFGELNLRLIHVIFGFLTALVPLIYRLHIGNRAFYFSFLLLTNLNLILWSKEALTYSICFYLGTLFLIFLERFQNLPNKKNAIALSILITFISYYNYLLLVLITLNLVVMMTLNYKRKAIIKKYIYISIVPLLVFLPWFLNTGLLKKIIDPRRNVGFWNPPSSDVTQIYHHFLGVFNSSIPLTVIIFALLLYGVIKNTHKKIYVSTLVSALTYFLLSYLLLQDRLSIFVAKYLNIALPFFLMLCAMSLMDLGRKKAIAPLVLIIYFNLFESNKAKHRVNTEQTKEAFEFIAKDNPKKVFLNVKRPIWYVPYSSTILNAKIMILGKDEVCRDFTEQGKYIKQLMPGDYIYQSWECSPLKIKNYLSQQGYLFHETHFLGGLSVMKIENTK